MIEGEQSLASGAANASAAYLYPEDLARFVRARWTDVSVGPVALDLLPEAASLEEFFSVCYHASMLREEKAPVTFRAILAAPSMFPVDGRPPDGVERLDFTSSLPFDPDGLRRLSVAADPTRTLIGVRAEALGPRIWGLINSGTRWLRNIQGGRRAGGSLPPVPVVHVDAPAAIYAYKGNEFLGKLRGGKISGARVDLFESKWLPSEFAGFRAELMQRHAAARGRATEFGGERWATLDATLPRRIAERMTKRVISVLRDSRHGGTIVFLPPEYVGRTSDDDAYIDLKYPFAEGASRRSFSDLIVDILNRLAQLYGAAGDAGPIGWREFEKTTDDKIATLDEGLFDFACMIAGQAATDGAVVMSTHHEYLGFGGMISGRLPAIRSVARALDLEAEQVCEENTGNVGARHRSAYRLAGAVPGSVVIVISQDGGVRFVCQKGHAVTYWEQE